MRTHAFSRLPRVFCAVLVLIFAAGAAGPAFTAQYGEPITLVEKPSLDAVLKDLATFDGGLDSDAFWKMRTIVIAAKDDPTARKGVEAKLLAFLDTPATPVAKDSVCRMLRIIGGDASVPVLRRLLAAADTTGMARYALERIPGDAAEAALLDALGTSAGAVKLGVISSLADRKSTKAVAALGTLLLDSNPDLAVASAYALGRIGGKSAADALGKALGSGVPQLKTAVSSALVLCADQLLAQKDASAAAGLYDRVLVEKLTPALRRAAMRGKIMASGDRAVKLILAALAGSDPDLQLAAVAQIKAVFAEADIAPVCAALAKLPDASQVALIAVLSEYKGAAVTAALTSAVKSDAKAVRLAALKAFEKAGDASSVGLLAGAAAAAPPDEQAAARIALWGMKGKPVDTAILALLGGSPAEAVQAELVRSIGERAIFTGKVAAAKLADSPSEKVRREAVRTIRTIGTPSDIPGLLNILLKTADENEQIGIETAISGLALKIAQPEGRASAVKDRWDAVKDGPGRAVLCRLLGRIGDNSTLPLLRQALDGADPAVADAAGRALAAWPTSAAKDDIIRIARTSKNTTIQVLAVRGYIRLTAAEKYRRPEEAVKDMKLALDLSSRPEEMKLVLGALPDFAGPEALALAESLSATPAVQEEAKTAIKKIQDKLKSAV
jgi:HEAT repeat protein